MKKILGLDVSGWSSLDYGLALAVLSGAILSAGSLFRGIKGGSQVQYEYINSAQGVANEVKMVAVDVEGGVERPGVYELAAGSRIKDALVAAGGLRAEADRNYSERNINLAQVLVDGQKIYIPMVSDTLVEAGYVEANNGQIMVNINTASMGELDTLWGVGEVRASAIVKNRPYVSIEEAVKKGALTKQIVEKNKDRLSVY